MAGLWWNSRQRQVSEATSGIGEWKFVVKDVFERNNFTDVRFNDIEVAGGKDDCWVSVAHFHIADRNYWEVVMAGGRGDVKAVVDHTVAMIAAISVL